MTVVGSLDRLRWFRGVAYSSSLQECEGMTLAVERFPQCEPPEGRTFVLVHGIGVSSRYFHPLAVELAASSNVYLVDLPGFGAAPKPKQRDITLDDHAAVLAAFLRRTELENPVLVGHSWGCQVVAALAEQHPDVSDRIVLMAPTMEPSARTVPRGMLRLFRDSLREPFRVVAIAAIDYLVRCRVPYLFQQMPNMMADRIEDRVGANGSPVLVLTGDRDPIASREWGAELASRAQFGRHREVHGPHVVMHSDPRTVADELRRFVDETD